MSEDLKRGAPEPDVLPARLIMGVVVATVVVTVLLVIWAWRIQVRREAALRRPSAAGRIERPPGLPPPKIETALFTNVDRAVRLKAAQQQRLSTYGWVDREQGLVRVPIERAMDIMAGGERQ